MLGTLHAEPDGRFSLRFEMPLAHSRQLVWHAITQPEPLSCWFPARVQFRLEKGSPLLFKPTSVQIERFGIAVDQVGAGKVTEVNPGELLEFTWNEESIRWELRDDGKGGSILTFKNVMTSSAEAAAIAGAWHAGLEVMQAQLDGRKLEESMWERAEELARDYALTMS